MLIINPVQPAKIELLTGSYPKGQFLNSQNQQSENIHIAEVLENARKAGEAHRRSRYMAQQILKPGVAFSEVISTIENSTRIMLAPELNNGIGFPTGMSLNDCAAHFTLNPNDPEIFLGENDVLKVDFGTHVDGVIMDSAFTVAFNPRYEPLLKASQEATEAGIRALGVDVRVTDIGAVIAETMRGFEIEIDGKILPIRPVENLCGHSIDKFTIHAGLSIPNVKNNDRSKIKPDTFYAIETFATTGKGIVRDGKNTSHYIGEFNGLPTHKKENKEVLEIIKKKLKTLPFCPRYVDNFVDLPKGSHLPIKALSALKHLKPYPPLMDNVGSYVAQFEHTVYLSEFGKEILTRGDDY